MHNFKVRIGVLLVACVAMFALAGCGHSEDEWQQAQRDINAYTLMLRRAPSGRSWAGSCPNAIAIAFE